MRKKLMQKRRIRAAAAILFAASILISGAAQVNAAPQNSSMPKNVIIMISDGCGPNHILATDYYQNGAANSQIYETFPVKCFMSTYPSGGSYDTDAASKNFDYLKTGFTDSAAAATAMSTGTKTYDGAIGVGIDGKKLKNISEAAEELGKSTGVVTTVEISHATPAGFTAHNASRENYSDIAKEMITETGLDVIMGTGNPFFDNNGKKLSQPGDYKYVGGESIWDGLVNKNLKVSDADGDGIPDQWNLIQTKSEFEALESGKTPKRVIGIAQVYATLQQARSGNTDIPYAAPRNNTVPDLSTMAKAAINVLDDNKNGFFLMIEGGAVDWASHSNQTGRMIEEETDFNNAVTAVCRWIETNSSWNDTLLIVTSDHETGYITGPQMGAGITAVINNGKSKVPLLNWNSTGHTNSLVPVFAKGAGAEKILQQADNFDTVRGIYLDNTELLSCIADLSAKNGWIYSGGTWYYYKNGEKLKNSWAQDSHGWCFLDGTDGSWVKEGWRLDSHGWCYIEDGYWVDHSMWARDSSGWVHINSNGYWDGKPGIPQIPGN